MGTARGLFASLGASGSLCAGGACLLLLGSAVVAFDGWPSVTDTAGVPGALLAHSPRGHANHDAATTPATAATAPLVAGSAPAAATTPSAGRRGRGTTPASHDAQAATPSNASSSSSSSTQPATAPPTRTALGTPVRRAATGTGQAVAQTGAQAGSQVSKVSPAAGQAVQQVTQTTGDAVQKTGEAAGSALDGLTKKP